MADQRIIASLRARLSLRTPQDIALRELADILDLIEPQKGQDVDAALAAVSAAYPQVSAFERAFPSLCFSLATGVGKTRLMGAFIAYLAATGRSKHFFVLAPNVTIYEKLLADFTPGTSKYVLKGLSEFASRPPIIISSDNWETGIGVRGGDLFDDAIHINIFNVDKINRDVKAEGRTGRAPKIKSIREYVGGSYFDYLAGLDDLVILMDEAHRYRATAGAKAIEDLKPILGLELTATPKAVGTNAPFKNVIYDYDLAAAMEAGYVKEPAVATRANFDPKSVSEEELEAIKLEDGVHHHEHVRVQLQVYAAQNSKPLVHPFMLVVATDTEHARRLQAFIEGEDFFGGRYKGRVVQIHSGLKGDESDANAQALLSIEKSGKTDIVIHVNKLKEGWDVTNLYTIVPLRASASDILTEQTLGRGLRLPYGKRTGVDAVDTLTVIAHDRFAQVIDAARTSGLIRKQVVIGGEGGIPTTGSRMVTSTQSLDAWLAPPPPPPVFGPPGEVTLDESLEVKPYALAQTPSPFVFESDAERQFANTVWKEALPGYQSRVRSMAQLAQPAFIAKIAQDATLLSQNEGGLLNVAIGAQRREELTAQVVNRFVEQMIEIPQLTLQPHEQVTFGFKPFALANLASINVQPMSKEVLVQQVRTDKRTTISQQAVAAHESRFENYLIGRLIEYDEVDYDAHAELLNSLCSQMVAHLQGYLDDDEQVRNVVIAHGKTLSDFIFEQMRAHMWKRETAYEVRVSAGFTMLKPQHFDVPVDGGVLDFRTPIARRSDIKRYAFEGFSKSCNQPVKFDSDAERRLAVLLEGDDNVVRWMKPGPGQFRIEDADGTPYNPDFVVETKAAKIIIEPKRDEELTDAGVLAKARAASVWCWIATEHHAKKSDGKPWTYALVPDTAINASATLGGLVATYTRQVDMAERMNVQIKGISGETATL
jgi:type III restriction enzyme